MEFPIVRVAGGAHERGKATGDALKPLIHRNCRFYEDIIFDALGLSAELVVSLGRQARTVLHDFDAALEAEIMGMAAGAEIEPVRLFALNARTEILNSPGASTFGVTDAECTSLYFRDTNLIGQTWDWFEDAEAGCALIIHEPEGAAPFVIFTEAGMLGKIGMGKASGGHGAIGQCVNILSAPHALVALPTHILARVLTTAGSLEAARHQLKRAGIARASHLMVAEAGAGVTSIEYFGDRSEEIQPTDGTISHTNHCIARGADHTDCAIRTTYERLQKARGYLSTAAAPDRPLMRAILTDGSDGVASINAAYGPSASFPTLRTGTCATVIIDLENGQFDIARGPGNSQFQRISL